jgi:carboxyl-terminal processing protease
MRFALVLLLALFTLSAQFQASAQAASLQCQHLPMLFQLFLRGHYATKLLNDELKGRVAEQYVKSLDWSRVLLLESEATKLKKDLTGVFSTMTSGNCDTLDAAAKLVVERAQKDVELARETVEAKDYQIDETAEVNFDGEKRGYTKTEEERRALVKKMIHFQMSNYLLAETKMPEAKKQLIHRYELVVKRMGELREKGKLPEKLAEAFAVALDPHSSFLSRSR